MPGMRGLDFEQVLRSPCFIYLCLRVIVRGDHLLEALKSSALISGVRRRSRRQPSREVGQTADSQPREGSQHRRPEARQATTARRRHLDDA
jgi:hypothetical protein